jgi:amino-acid N-acetyltransferase
MGWADDRLARLMMSVRPADGFRKNRGGPLGEFLASTQVEKLSIAIRPARAGADIDAIKSLLKICDLPSDIDQVPDHFFVVTVNGKVVACAGLEVYPPVALARSLAVEMDQRSRGFGANLLTKLVERAGDLGLSEIYALTTTAQKYLKAHGFAPVERSDAPQILLDSAQFKSQCPASAVLLKMHVG